MRVWRQTLTGVSALFFTQSNKARQLMVDFFDRLRNDQKLKESLQLAADIPDQDLKSKLHILLSLNFAEIKPTDTFLTSLLGIRDPSVAQSQGSTQKLSSDIGKDTGQKLENPAADIPKSA
jgi:hypothetical protein